MRSQKAAKRARAAAAIGMRIPPPPPRRTKGARLPRVALNQSAKPEAPPRAKKALISAAFPKVIAPRRSTSVWARPPAAACAGAAGVGAAGVGAAGVGAAGVEDVGVEGAGVDDVGVEGAGAGESDGDAGG